MLHQQPADLEQSSDAPDQTSGLGVSAEALQPQKGFWPAGTDKDQIAEWNQRNKQRCYVLANVYKEVLSFGTGSKGHSDEASRSCWQVRDADSNPLQRSNVENLSLIHI